MMLMMMMMLITVDIKAYGPALGALAAFEYDKAATFFFLFNKKVPSVGNNTNNDDDYYYSDRSVNKNNFGELIFY